MLFAGISGSGLADTATMGSVFIPVMKKEGYRLDFSTAITVTSSVIGPIIPPSIIMVIYAMIAQVSVGGLFLTGFVPGILLGGVLILGAYIISIRHGYKKREEKYPVKEALRIILSAVPLMIVSVIILGGIFSGAFTATESSFVAVLYTIIYLIAKKKINLRQLYLAAIETIEITAVLFLVIATANILSWVLANLQVQETIASVFRPIVHNKILLIIFYNTFFLITGCFLEAVPTIILFVPKLTPILVDAGFHPLHVGIMTVLPITFGMITPPVGVCLFVACGLTGLRLEELVKAEIPFVLSEIGVLFLISFFPFLPLWPARLFGY
jgi:tripartite ATP-independent transporter DctM subunit